ncbi:RNA polymerase sigma factor [Paenibacillus sp. R14(2021)]|uniref:RNA polymerase sigma factor n=1 Tax=Paenibacillus sp. R14(2021) TaxID=2859228 RepID=UPI00215770DB|nr:RNA polymerase sigma factor [Paenibacillus sp. R14(2021)]
MNGEPRSMEAEVRHPVQSELFEDRLRQLYNEMIAVAYAKVFNKSDAQDAVQEAWVRMLMSQNTLREQDKLRAWAKVITANAAHNINKQSGRVSPCGAEDLGSESRMFGHETAVMLEIGELLDMLEPRSRTLLLFKFYYGYKDQEIAAAMKLPVGTIKARIHRTKHHLRKWMS